jgi:hypothetical protein
MDDDIVGDGIVVRISDRDTDAVFPQGVPADVGIWAGRGTSYSFKDALGDGVSTNRVIARVISYQYSKCSINNGIVVNCIIIRMIKINTISTIEGSTVP